MNEQPTFWDPPVRGHRPTRSDAVKNRKAGQDRALSSKSRLHKAMLNCYWGQAWTDAELAERLGIERTTVNARRNELMKLGKVEEKGSKKNLSTGVMNTLFGLK